MTSPKHDLKSFEKQRRRPLKALRHFRNLVKNKEDTTQVFYIIQALNGDSFQKSFVKFANSETGQERIAENRYLPDILDNHDWLRTLPDESFGRAYLDFMQSEGLTAKGLVDEYVSSGIQRDFGHPDMNYYSDRIRDTHDMLHVLTGFGRDALGEACVLAYSYAQHGGLGVAFIAYGAGLEVRKCAPNGSPVLKAVREGQKMGKTAEDIIYEDVMALLPMHLDEVRKKMGIRMPNQYHDVHSKMRDNGMDPYQAIAAQTEALAA